MVDQTRHAAKTKYGLTGRDKQLILDLALKARLMTASQISDHYFNSKFRVASRRLRILCDRGWLVGTIAFVPQPPSIIRPLYSSAYGIDPPDFSLVSKFLLARSRFRQVVKQTIIRVTVKGILLTLGVKRLAKSPHHQIGHDIGMAEVILLLKRIAPKQYHQLIGEDCLTSEAFPGFLPDGIVETEDRVHVVEFGGAYDVDRLRVIHESCESLGVTYDLY